MKEKYLVDSNGNEVKVGNIVEFDNGDLGIVVKRIRGSFDVKVFHRYLNFCVLPSGDKPYFTIIDSDENTRLVDVLNGG